MYGTSGNSFVAVVEFGPTVRARAVTAGGASGNPSSPHFNDQAKALQHRRPARSLFLSSAAQGSHRANLRSRAMMSADDRGTRNDWLCHSDARQVCDLPAANSFFNRVFDPQRSKTA
jgi:hypothetical protein